jgi:hypothetical protein
MLNFPNGKYTIKKEIKIWVDMRERRREMWHYHSLKIEPPRFTTGFGRIKLKIGDVVEIKRGILYLCNKDNIYLSYQGEISEMNNYTPTLFNEGFEKKD